jgi:hypothetical protein
MFVPADAWRTVRRGFVSPLLGEWSLPPAANWILLAGLAAYSGAGGTPTIYYSALLALALSGCAAIALADPLTLILIGANVAGGNLVLLSFHTLRVNRKFLPRGVRPRLWREIGVLLCGLFFAAFALLALAQEVGFLAR